MIKKISIGKLHLLQCVEKYLNMRRVWLLKIF